MSRAINVAVSEPDVLKLCEKHGALISAIERLECGGTRVVLTNIEGTEKMRGIFGKKIISGNVRRTVFASVRS